MQIQPILAAVVFLTTWLPLPAAAEMHGAAACASPSWDALVSGQCGVWESRVAREASQVEADSSIALVDLAGTIPEPETYALMLVGLTAVGMVGRRRRRN